MECSTTSPVLPQALAWMGPRSGPLLAGDMRYSWEDSLFWLKMRALSLSQAITGTRRLARVGDEPTEGEVRTYM